MNLKEAKSEGCGKVTYKGGSFFGDYFKCGEDYICDECKQKQEKKDDTI